MKNKKLILLLLIISVSFIFSLSANAEDIGTPQKTVRAGFFYMPYFNEIKEDGLYYGYGYEVIENIAHLNNYKIEYLGHEQSLDEQLKALKNGEIDLIAGVNYKLDYQKEFLFSDFDIGNSPYVLLVRNNDNRYDSTNYDKWPKIKIGYYNYNDMLQQFVRFAKENVIDYELIRFNYIPDYDYLESESLDAFISSSYTAIDLNKYKICSYFGEECKYIITNKNNTALMAEINDAIDSSQRFDPDFYSKLKKKYFKVDIPDNIKFTLEERRYIKDHLNKPLKAYVYDDLKPFHYYENGKLSGILPQYIELINNITGLNIEIETVYDYEKYCEYLSDSENIIYGDYVFSYLDADKYGVRISYPYINVPVAKVFLKNKTTSSGKFALYSVFEPASMEQYRYIENENVLIYHSIDETLKDLLNQKIDSAYIPYYSAKAYCESVEYSQLQYDIIIDNNISYSFAANNEGDVLLTSILSKTINYVGDSVLQDMLLSEVSSSSITDYSFVDYIRYNPWITWLILGILLLIITLFIVLMLKNYKDYQDRLLSEQITEKFNAILSTNIMALEIEMIDSKFKYYTYHIVEKNGKNKILQEEKSENDLDILFKMLHPEDASLKYMFFDGRFVENLILNKNIYKEVRASYKENDPNYYYVGITASYSESDSIKKILILFKDIDNAKKDEEEKRYTLQMALDTAQSYGKLRNIFLSQITHDLRTPMNAIVGMTTIAQLNLNNTEKVSECLDTISNSSGHLIALLNDILDVTRIESGRFKFNQKRTRIKSVLKNTIEMLSKKAKDNNIDIIVDDSSVIHDHILTDENRLEQVFGNIISNAIKYSDKNNKVEITLTEISHQNDNTFYYEFIVKDYGIGMSDETMANLYTPFERGEEAKFAEGTGLGMTITKSIIEAMGGIITVNSKLKEGTTVTVNLSFTDESINSLSNISELAGQNALVISEDTQIRDLLSAIFEEGNMKCTSMDKFELSDVFVEKDFLVIACYINDSLDETGKKLVQIRNIVGRKTIIISVRPEDISILTSLTKDYRNDGFVSIYNCKEELIRLVSDTIDSKKLSEKIKIESTLKGKRVLIVEDVEINAIFAKAISEMKGLETDMAANGKEAIEKLQNSSDGYYNIVFMDLHMPVMDGFTAVSFIRKSDRKYLKKIPIIAMSANTFPEDIIRCKKVGMNDYISKPIELNVFSEITEKYAK